MALRHNVTSVNKEVVPASRLPHEDRAGDRTFIAFSHSSYNN